MLQNVFYLKTFLFNIMIFFYISTPLYVSIPPWKNLRKFTNISIRKNTKNIFSYAIHF